MAHHLPVQPEIRAELGARVDAVSARAHCSRPGEIAAELEAIRSLARRNGIRPAVTVIHAIDSALARGEHGALVQGWLAILRDAVDSDLSEPNAETLFTAACSVRLNG
ncbi:hypothetical protein [Stakelama saccharophila]|uniref:Uncharacterized protein n=1 Tax=Stakelama saccharophila TaxID=3075605 RepID=A0ABZ0BC62_9SPHN|nr:hypothetical protein [Stakelama sp. W311]WNO54251.1 hypothetical protein RPR59_03025 [Stakelama sp. W311]